MCMDLHDVKDGNGHRQWMYACQSDKRNVNQHFYWDAQKKLLKDAATKKYCLDHGGNKKNEGKVHMWECGDSINSNQIWNYDSETNAFSEPSNKFCLDHRGAGKDKDTGKDDNGVIPHMWKCDPGKQKPNRTWDIQYI